jgi:hypothetical protein
LKEDKERKNNFGVIRLPNTGVESRTGTPQNMGRKEIIFATQSIG